MSNPEQALWRAVIAQAITDASGKGSLCSTYEQARAHDWLLIPNRDFSRACALADLEPDYVRAQARKAIAKHGDIATPEPACKPTRQRNKLYEFNGRSNTLTAWAAEIGCDYASLYRRVVVHGWTVERAASVHHQRNT